MAYVWVWMIGVLLLGNLALELYPYAIVEDIKTYGVYKLADGYECRSTNDSSSSR